MPAVIPFIPLIAAGVAGGATIAATQMSNNANDRAAQGQLSAQNHAADLEDRQFEKAEWAAREERDYNRWLQQATSAARQPYLDQLAAAIGQGFGSFSPQTYTPETYTPAEKFKAPDPRELLNDPGYQFELAEGNAAVERSGIAQGTFLTGGTGKALQQYGQGLAATRGKERYDRALGEYSLAETLRAQAFDRNEAGKMNAANINNQGAYQAASLASQGAASRLSALSSLASLAGPIGPYPGQGYNEPGAPLPGFRDPAFRGGPENPIGTAPEPIFPGLFAPPKPKALQAAEETQNPWSGALIRRTV